MENALGEAQTIVLLGCTSDLGMAIVERLASPATTAIVLAARDPAAADVGRLEAPGRVVDAVPFDGAATETHQRFVDALVEAYGDLDVVVLAFGQLGDPATLASDPTAAAALAHVNYTGAVSVATAVAAQFRRQGHGRLVVLTSVAGERVRKANYVYGSSKAGLDGFAQGLGDALAGTGASVLIVRPGFIHTKMSAGLPAPPFASTPDVVAEATARGLRDGKRIVWAPGILRYIFIVMRHLPHVVWRRIRR
jgi:decaprenylphospho-beta-D-erythro-pentofuranosid-2-ulose 2-reductase